MQRAECDNTHSLSHLFLFILERQHESRQHQRRRLIFVVFVITVASFVEDVDHLLVATALAKQVAGVPLALVTKSGVNVLEFILLQKRGRLPIINNTSVLI